MAMSPSRTEGHREGEGGQKEDIQRRRWVERRDPDDQWQDKEDSGQHLGLSPDCGDNSVVPLLCGAGC